MSKPNNEKNEKTKFDLLKTEKSIMAYYLFNYPIKVNCMKMLLYENNFYK